MGRMPKNSGARAHGGTPRRAPTGTNGATGRDDLEDLFIADDDEAQEVGAGVKDDPDGAEGSDDDDDDDEEFAEGHEGEPCDFAEGEKLPAPSIVTQTLTAIVDLLNGPYLDLHPPYQRGVVWTKDRMSALIGSLYDNFYVPPVIFNIHRERVNGGAERFRRVCVDGKQRLSSVKAFMEGQIPVRDADGNRWFYGPSVTAAGKPMRGQRILPERLREAFRKKALVCYDYEALSRTQEEDLFARVQKGMPLNYAEKFRATRGEWQSLADMFERDFNDVMKLSGNKRASGWRNLLACFSQIMEVDNPSGVLPVLKTSHQNIEKMLKHPDLCDAAIKSQLRRVFTTFASLLRKRPATFSNNAYENVKTFSPVEMVVVSVLISHYPDRPERLLHGDILLVRKELRRANRDLKLNNTVWRDSWELIEKLESIRGAVDGSTVLRGRDDDASSSSGDDDSDDEGAIRSAVQRRRNVAPEQAIVYAQPKAKATTGRKSTSAAKPGPAAPAIGSTTSGHPGPAQAQQGASAGGAPRSQRTNVAEPTARGSKSVTGNTSTVTSGGRPSHSGPSRAAADLPVRGTGTPTQAPSRNAPIPSSSTKAAGFSAINSNGKSSAGQIAPAGAHGDSCGPVRPAARTETSAAATTSGANNALPRGPAAHKARTEPPAARRRSDAPGSGLVGSASVAPTGVPHLSMAGPGVPAPCALPISRKRRERLDLTRLHSPAPLAHGGKRVKLSPEGDDQA